MILTVALVYFSFYLSKLLQNCSSLPFLPLTGLQSQEQSSGVIASRATLMVPVSGLQSGASFVQQFERFFFFSMEMCG